MTDKINIPLPASKPQIRKASEIIAQAQSMMQQSEQK